MHFMIAFENKNKLEKFTNYRQADFKDCGPTCLKIIAKHYGKTINIQELRDISETTRRK